MYEPGSTVILNCTSANGFPPLEYQWTSTCTGSCFVLAQASDGVVSTNLLHSIDSGNHTCMITDNAAKTGNATFEIRVEGNHALCTIRDGCIQLAMLQE